MKYKTQLQSVWNIWHNFVLRGCNNWATHSSYRYKCDKTKQYETHKTVIRHN